MAPPGVAHSESSERRAVRSRRNMDVRLSTDLHCCEQESKSADSQGLRKGSSPVGTAEKINFVKECHDAVFSSFGTIRARFGNRNHQSVWNQYQCDNKRLQKIWRSDAPPADGSSVPCYAKSIADDTRTRAHAEPFAASESTWFSPKHFPRLKVGTPPSPAPVAFTPAPAPKLAPVPRPALGRKRSSVDPRSCPLLKIAGACASSSKTTRSPVSTRRD